jgi:hypothetical protein
MTEYAEPYSIDNVKSLVDAAISVLDDMDKDGKCCCLYAKAKLRVAVEPFLDPIDHKYYDQFFMSFAAAQEVINECD